MNNLVAIPYQKIVSSGKSSKEINARKETLAVPPSFHISKSMEDQIASPDLTKMFQNL